VAGALVGAVLPWVSLAAPADDAALARLAWLGGCWASLSAEPGSLEQWMPPAGGTMLGMSRTVRQGRTVEHEFMQVRAAAGGTLVFVAHPSGQPGATFPLLQQSDTEVVFQNLQHDFPQRIAYRMDSPTTLTARIEGMRNGTLRIIEFPMTRTRCEASPGPR
jgi:Domain of unknown function (DUF6265)